MQIKCLQNSFFSFTIQSYFVARVTIEEVLSQCESAYELAVLLAYRANAIATSNKTAVDSDNKFAVLALREVEAVKVSIEELRDTVIRKYANELKGNVVNNNFLIDDTSVEEPIFDVEKKDNSVENNSTGIDLGVSKDFFASES